MVETEFYRRVEAWFSKFIEENPVAATQLGDHRFDHRLGEHHPQALARQERLLWEALAELGEAKTEGWSLDAQVDHVLVTHLVRSFLREFGKVQAHKRNPFIYLGEVVGGIGLLLLREFAPFPKRLESVRGRLSEVPRVLREGKENLEPPKVPKVWAEVATEGARRSLPFFRFVIPALSLGVPRLAPKMLKESQRAANALSDFIKFLQHELLPQAQGDFAAGKELFEEIMREDHMLAYSAQELVELGWKIFEGTKGEMEALAKKIEPGKSAREIIEEAKAWHPRPGAILYAYRREIARAREFVEGKKIVTIPPGEKLQVRPTPPALRPTIPYAAYLMPGPLEEKQEGVFLITPIERFAPRRVQVEKLRGHSFAKIPVTVVHEAYPGHHLQLVFANHYAKTLPRKLGSALSSLFVEGWAFYCEELMEGFGYLTDPVQKLMRLQDQLWRAARVILDVLLHTEGMGVEEGVEFLAREAGLERTNALAEVRRYTMSPTQPLSYLVGKLEILKVIEEYKERSGATLREIHDAILSCGSLPPRLLRQLLS